MNPALTEGLEIVGIVSVAASIFIPVFCWVLVHPLNQPEIEKV